MNTRRPALTALLAALTLLPAKASVGPDSASVHGAGLPVLTIQTINNEEPTCDYVFAPDGAFGISIRHATKVPGRAVLTTSADTLFDSGEYVKGESGMTIKIRGNTSAYYYDKKPYKIKLQKKADMLSRGDKRHNDKDWVLIKDGDGGLKQMAGFLVNRLVGMPWTPAYTYVNLMVNGDYRGIYMLAEQVGRNADARLNVDKNTGYIIECDAYWWNEDVYFTTDMQRNYTFKYPDADDVTAAQLDYISGAVGRMEQSISDGTYPQTIDVGSFAAWLLAHDILGTYDSGGSNIYLTKYDDTDGSLIAMSTLWDFDSCQRTEGSWSRVHGDFFYFSNLFSSVCDDFAVAYKKTWDDTADALFDALDRQLIDFRSSATAAALDRSRAFDRQRWGTDSVSVSDDVDELLTWFRARRQWLRQAIAAIDAGNGVRSVTTADTSRPAVYNLNGQRMAPADGPSRGLPHGIYIKNGKKFAR